MTEIEFDAEGELADESVSLDPVAERIREYRLLAESLDKIKTKEIKAEGIQMLEKVRRSFRGYSDAPLRSIAGGRGVGDKPL